jgi:hypothetical protein
VQKNIIPLKTYRYYILFDEGKNPEKSIENEIFSLKKIDEERKEVSIPSI